MKSKNWKMWSSIRDPRRCEECAKLHGKIYARWEKPVPEPPLHKRGRCTIELLDALLAGTATKDGKRGADWWLKRFGHLPQNYISRKDAKKLGWKRWARSLYTVAPGKMLFGGVYENDNKHLPVAEGRVWYEADVNYKEGRRGSDRILFSNDGLIFVTYDHYETFVEII